MATTPGFANVPNVGANTPSAFDASTTAPTTAVVVLTAGASGTRIDEIRCMALSTTVVGLVRLFLHDGTTHHLFDEVSVIAWTAGTTSNNYLQVRQYANLVMKSGWNLRATVTVSGLNGAFKVSAFGADF